MATFLIEVHVGDAGASDLERAVRMLDAAQARMRGSEAGPHETVAALSRGDGRLVCLIDAPSLEAAHRLVSVALPPGARIREITDLAGLRLLRGHPGGDLDAGVEAELVEDVVDVGLDRPLGEEQS
jgi:hypothetical protein